MTSPVAEGWAEAGSSDEEPGQAGPARQALRDERAFLLRSLQDLEAERQAGDLDPDDYEALRSRYTARAAAVLRALEAPAAAGGSDEAGDRPARGPSREAGDAREAPGQAGHASAAGDQEATAAAPPHARRRRRRLLVGGAVACFAVAAVVLVVGELGVGLPGDPVTGSPTLTDAQQVQRLLAQGEEALLENRSAEAVAAFEQVLKLDPTQEEALSEVGWLEFAAGVRAGDRSLVRAGQQDEDTAVARQPGQFGPRFYLGAMLAQEGQKARAVEQFEAGLADDAPASTVAVFAPTIDKVFGEDHVPVPHSVAAAVASVGSAASSASAGSTGTTGSAGG